MAPVFLPWNGSAQPLEETFAKTLPFGLTGVVWVRPKSLEIYPGLAVGNAQIGITATAGCDGIYRLRQNRRGRRYRRRNCLAPGR